MLNGCSGPAPVGPDLVYRLDPAFTGDVRAVLRPAGFDGLLAVLADCPARACTALADAAGVGGVEEVAFAVTAGVPVDLVVDGPGGGPFELELRAGESCVDAIAVGSLPFTARNTLTRSSVVSGKS